MNRPIDTAVHAVEYAFGNYSGDCEAEDHLQNIAWHVSDLLELMGDALQQPNPATEEASRCAMRCADQLRLALRLGQEETEGVSPQLFIAPLTATGAVNLLKAEAATDEAMAELGWIRASEARKAVSILIADVPEQTANIDNPAPEAAS